jgi:hypothetical protein
MNEKIELISRAIRSLRRRPGPSKALGGDCR